MFGHGTNDGNQCRQRWEGGAPLQPLVSVSVLSWCVLVSTRLCGAVCLPTTSTFPVLPPPRVRFPVCRAGFVSFYPQNRDQAQLTLNSFSLTLILMITSCIFYFLGSARYRLRTLLPNHQTITFDLGHEYCLLRWPYGFISSLVCLGTFLNVKCLHFHHVTSPCFAAVFCCMTCDQILIDSILIFSVNISSVVFQ